MNTTDATSIWDVYVRIVPNNEEHKLHTIIVINTYAVRVYRGLKHEAPGKDAVVAQNFF